MPALQPHGLQVPVALDPSEDVVGDIPVIAEAHDGIPLRVEQLAPQAH